LFLFMVHILLLLLLLLLLLWLLPVIAGIVCCCTIYGHRFATYSALNALMQWKERLTNRDGT
jgi:fatty acid desaturase